MWEGYGRGSKIFENQGVCRCLKWFDAMSLAWPTVVELLVSFNSGFQWGINQEYSFFVSSQ